MPDIQDRIDTLEAKATALTMLVNMLLANFLRSQENPQEIARAMIDDIFKKDRMIMNGPNDKHAMKISEALISSIDHALARVPFPRDK